MDNDAYDSPFLHSLGSFVRRKIGTAAFCSDVASWRKPPTLSSLSPEVLARLRFVDNAAKRQRDDQSSTPGTENTLGEEDRALFGEGGSIEWSRVQITSEDALADGARLAVVCHAALRRHHHRRQKREAQLEKHRTSPAPPAVAATLPQEETKERLQLPGVVEGIVRTESSDEEVYVALCVCLTILERALYDIYREGARNNIRRQYRLGKEQNSDRTLAHEGGSEYNKDAEGSASVVAPAMILRDLIATPEVKAALPEQMVAILYLLLLPMGFNIRNLVWHGFLAPCELPRELASLVLVVTLSISADSLSAEEIGNDQRVGWNGGPPALQPLNLAQPPPLPNAALQLDRPPSVGWWALDSFDNRLACPRALTSAVEFLLTTQHRNELNVLVKQSAFVLPGREHMAMLALRALGVERDGQGHDKGQGNTRGGAAFLVAVLPVLEHGLRCLFSCANDSPEHLFAHVQQYYSTLDGFGQRARHQLLLDQEMSGFPNRPNLLLSALGPGLSACLLDIFMMSAGPNLRGKVAHGEIDVSRVFFPSPPCPQTAPDIVLLTACLFLVLCRRHGPVGNVVDLESEGVDQAGGPNGSFSSAFVEALDACEAHCSGWVPRFHPHELLEADLRACRDELDSLALALERREMSVEILHESKGQELARMSVEISGDASSCCGISTCTQEFEKGEEEGNKTRQEDCRGEPERNINSQPFGGRMVLTVTDTASRLVPPSSPEPGISNRGGSLPWAPRARGDVRGKPQSKKNAETASGVFTGLARVDKALGEHAVSIARRFERHRGIGESSTLTPTSAFAIHYNEKLRSSAVSSGSHCLDRCHHGRLRDSSAFLLDNNLRRISPPTNVMTCVPLPQRQMMSMLCRACAEGARGLRERIEELEVPLSSGSARSGQRRAYAATLQVAPSLLRFLASAAASVELFVIEWDQRHGDEPSTADGPNTATPSTPIADTAGLSFLRRLVAVNGALGLCVAAGKGAVRPPTNICCRNGSGGEKGAACKEKSGGSAKKGFVQALAELASFLETKTARQGFAGYHAREKK